MDLKKIRPIRDKRSFENPKNDWKDKNKKKKKIENPSGKTPKTLQQSCVDIQKLLTGSLRAKTASTPPNN